MPMYTYVCPTCGKEITDLYTLHEPPPQCENPEQHPTPVEMKKSLGKVSFKI